MISTFTTLEESELRTHFNAEYGPYLPEDLCLFVKNEPTIWHVVPSDDTPLEEFPEIDRDLINEVIVFNLFLLLLKIKAQFAWPGQG